LINAVIFKALNKNNEALSLHHDDSFFSIKTQHSNSIKVSMATFEAASQHKQMRPMPFGLLARVGPRNNVLDGVQIPHGRGNYDGERGSPL